MREVTQNRAGGHLTEKTLSALVLGTLGTDEKIEALEHLALCEECSERFTAHYDDMELLKLPPQFSERVYASLRRYAETEPSRKRIEPQVKKSSGGQPAGGQTSGGKSSGGRKADWQTRRKEYRRYALHVVTAACFTLVILFSGSFSDEMNMLHNKMVNPDFSHMEKLSQSLSDFSSQLLNWEDN